MYLSDPQKTQVRYYCGYGMYGDQAMPANGYRFITQYGELEYKMITLLPDEYDKIVNFFLVNLPVLETDVYGVRNNMDTKQAAVWYWNEKEQRDRTRLYNYFRKELCRFLNIPPGEGLGSSFSFAV